jgi:hypothetical protein
MTTIDTLAKQFMDAGAALGEAMTKELEQRDPSLAATVAGAIAAGQHLRLGIAFDPVLPQIQLDAVDTHGSALRVMHIGAEMPRRRQ